MMIYDGELRQKHQVLIAACKNGTKTKVPHFPWLKIYIKKKLYEAPNIRQTHDKFEAYTEHARLAKSIYQFI